ncbi:YesL family protein [Salibacterium sp. K-3]
MLEKSVTVLDDIFRWISRLALLNLLWLLTSLAGLIAAGVFPALSAMLAVTRKWVLEGTEFPLIKTYLYQVKCDFWKANAIGWMLTGTAGLLYVNYEVLMQWDVPFSVVITAAFYFLVFLFLLVVVNIFPLFVHYEAAIGSLFKNALIIGFARLPLTIVFLFLLGGMVYFSAALPAASLFFSGSLVSFTVMKLMLWSLKKVDARIPAEEEMKYSG